MLRLIGDVGAINHIKSLLQHRWIWGRCEVGVDAEKMDQSSQWAYLDWGIIGEIVVHVLLEILQDSRVVIRGDNFNLVGWIRAARKLDAAKWERPFWVWRRQVQYPKDAGFSAIVSAIRQAPPMSVPQHYDNRCYLTVYPWVRPQRSMYEMHTSVHLSLLDRFRRRKSYWSYRRKQCVGKISIHQSGLALLAVLIYPGNHICCRKYLCNSLYQVLSSSIEHLGWTSYLLSVLDWSQ